MKADVIIMIVISGFTIKIHKGNAAGFQLQLKGEELPVDGTIIRFRVRKNENYSTPVIEKLTPIRNGVIDIDLYPEDTRDIHPGDYHWNLAIMYDEGEEPWTLLESAPLFIILPEDGRCDG